MSTKKSGVVGEDSDTIVVYSGGLVCASACAPLGAPKETVEAEVNAQSPTGIRSRWTVVSEMFANGDPNPCPCNDYPDKRQHWLLDC